MEILLSPAKKMRRDTDTLAPAGLPLFVEQAQTLASYLGALSYGELKKLLGCNDAIAQENFERYRQMDLQSGLTPAILAYQGIQYQYMAPQVFTDRQFAYVQDHVWILSGLYGLLRPLDGVTPYRLEMQARLEAPFAKSLYQFWGDRLYQALAERTQCLVNLASAEYARAVLPYGQPGMEIVTCLFAQEEGGKLVQKGVHVKMARGEMVRFLAEGECTRPEQMQAFQGLGFSFRRELSRPDTYVFTRS